MPRIGIQELLIIAGIAMLIFGPSQLPKLGRGLGQTIREFRKVGKELTSAGDDLKQDVNEINRNLQP